MNFTGALMGAANASQGYLEGQQTATDNRLRNQLNALNIQNTEDQLVQQRQQRESQSAIIDAMMMNSAGQPVSLGAGSPQRLQQPPQNPNQVLEQQGQALSRGMDAALATGNFDAYSKLLNGYTNIQSQLTSQQEKQSAITLSGLKAQQQEYETVARLFQGVTNEQEYNAAMQQVLNDPNIPQQSKINLSQIPYSQGRVQLIVSRGLSAAENAKAQMQTQEQAERVRHNQQQEAEARRRDNFTFAARVAEIQSKTSGNKTGAKITAPTSNDIKLASSYVKNNLGLTGNTSTNENFEQAVNTVASIAKQLMARNQAYSYPSALAMATQVAKDNGQLNIKDTPSQPKTFMGIPYGTTPEQKTIEAAGNKGTTSGNPLPLPHGATADTLMPGMWYQYTKGGKSKVGQWDGTKFVPVNTAAAM